MDPSIRTVFKQTVFPEGQADASKAWHHQHPSPPQEHWNKHVSHLSPLNMALSFSVSLSVPRQSAWLPTAGLEYTKYHYLYFKPAGLYNSLFCRVLHSHSVLRYHLQRGSIDLQSAVFSDWCERYHQAVSRSLYACVHLHLKKSGLFHSAC